MTINYELVLKLKQAGFPFRVIHLAREFSGDQPYIENEQPLIPTLSELIKACSELESLEHINRTDRNEWIAYGIEQEPWNPKSNASGKGSTPEEAVANLWLVLNTK